MGQAVFCCFYLACGLLSALAPCNLGPLFRQFRRLAPLGRSQV